MAALSMVSADSVDWRRSVLAPGRTACEFIIYNFYFWTFKKGLVASVDSWLQGKGSVSRLCKTRAVLTDGVEDVQLEAEAALEVEVERGALLVLRHEQEEAHEHPAGAGLGGLDLRSASRRSRHSSRLPDLI